MMIFNGNPPSSWRFSTAIVVLFTAGVLNSWWHRRLFAKIITSSERATLYPEAKLFRSWFTCIIVNELNEFLSLIWVTRLLTVDQENDCMTCHKAIHVYFSRFDRNLVVFSPLRTRNTLSHLLRPNTVQMLGVNRVWTKKGENRSLNLFIRDWDSSSFLRRIKLSEMHITIDIWSLEKGVTRNSSTIGLRNDHFLSRQRTSSLHQKGSTNQSSVG